MLFYAFNSTFVLRDFCHSKAVLYLGKKIFISKDNFESSLPPLIIPKSMRARGASVTSALFTSDSKLLLVVNKKVYMYNYLWNRWHKAIGIFQPVSHISGDKCCFKNEFCLELSYKVFAYLRGGPLPRTKIYYSDNGGFSFQYLASKSLDGLEGTLGGIFHFHSLSQVGILEVKDKLARSSKPCSCGEGTQSLPPISLTWESTSTASPRLPDQPLWSEETGISFTDTGMLEVLTPVADPQFPAFDFQKCIVNVQAVLNMPDLQIEPCNVEFLDSTMVEQMFTIDMNSQLDLSALMIPRPGKIPIPLVMVSNPHSLGLEAHIIEFGNTFDGNYKYKLEIELRQQQHQDSADLNFTTSIKRNTISSVTVDIADKTVACVDLKPLSTLISIGCDKTKKILVQNKISACSMGILSPVELQRNYTYTIEKEAYRPISYDAPAQSDLVVYYQYEKLGCPRLVYYDKPWKPVVEMWKNGILEEIMNAEYVISEVNGITTYSYSLTAATANCRSQPQNWSTFKSEFDFLFQRTLWNRENYISCHEDNKDNPLLWPEVEYQILGGQTDNRVIFGQRNGIYTFLLSVVDPYYSYCNLETMFSVYVDGALPMAFFSPELSITLLVFTTLLSMWLAYAIPKELSTERGQRFRNFCSWLFQGCLGRCRWDWLWSSLRLWLRSRRVGDQPERIPRTQRNQTDFQKQPDTEAVRGL